MPDIHITRAHTMPVNEVRQVVERLADKLQRKFGLEPRWEGNTLHISRSGVTGQIAFDDKQVQVDVRLGLLLAPLKSTVETEILDKLDEYFPGSVS